jgi:DNA processing protein
MTPNPSIDTFPVAHRVRSPGAMVHHCTPESLLGPLNDVERARAPKELFVAGDLDLFLGHTKVSVVGSRKASPQGLSRAKRISKILADRGIVVVSGLADGIDAAAHKGAIDAGGRTIGVIGTSLEKAYPRINRDLQHLMMREHAVVSQFPSGYPTLPGNFVRRNATMALMVSASIIVEAGDTSGALSHGWEALRLGRILLIMNSVLENPKLTWPSKMLAYGAQVLSDDNLQHYLDELPIEAPVDGIIF